MKNKQLVRSRKHKGASSVEWIVLVGLIVIGCITAWSQLGKQIQNSLQTQGDKIKSAAGGGG